MENTIRKKEWQSWININLQWPWMVNLKFLVVKPFWYISDYGSSTRKIIFWFFILSAFFAALYYGLGKHDFYRNNNTLNPGVVDKLFPKICKPSSFNSTTALRSLYFSIVTMTTLGFGDMHANKDSRLGHVLLMFQVILGYLLLGAMVTRFAVLFSGIGPAQPFEGSEEDRDWRETKWQMIHGQIAA